MIKNQLAERRERENHCLDTGLRPSSFDAKKRSFFGISNDRLNNYSGGIEFLSFLCIIEGEETEEEEEEEKKEEEEKYMKYPRSLTLLNNILILSQQHFLIKVNEKFLREFIAHLYIHFTSYRILIGVRLSITCTRNIIL